MADLTRRGLLGAGGSLLGLAACNQAPTGDKPAIVTRDDRPAYEGEVSFEHGVASGDPLPSAVIVWTRVTPGPDSPQTDIPVTYRIYAEAGLETLIASGLALAKPGADFTVKIDAKGLSADTEYYFQFVAKTAGGEVASPVGRTKTTAASGDAPVRFAVISCANYPFGQFHVYREISQDRALDAVIHLGDYIYEYGLDGYGGDVGQQIDRNHEPPLETVTLDDYRTRHAQYKTDPDLQAAHAAAPWLCTWDDHESTNDSYRNGAENHNPGELITQPPTGRVDAEARLEQLGAGRQIDLAERLVRLGDKLFGKIVAADLLHIAVAIVEAVPHVGPLGERRPVPF
ncbi:MAG: alkaline phosphatase D family protein, partial [Pseudomonadota bacterium]